MPVVTVSATACPHGLVEAFFVPVGNGAVSGYRPDPSDQGSLDICVIVAPRVPGNHVAPDSSVCWRRSASQSGKNGFTPRFSAAPGGVCGASQGWQRCGSQPDPATVACRVAVTGGPGATPWGSLAFHCQGSAAPDGPKTRSRTTQGPQTRHHELSPTRGAGCGHCGTHDPGTAADGSTSGIVSMSPATRVLHWMIRMYQSAFSGRPSPCRYIPTCSSYALDALEQRGLFSGSWLTIRRLARCHPWGGSGWDPVPGTDGSQHPSGAPGCVSHDQRNP